MTSSIFNFSRASLLGALVTLTCCLGGTAALGQVTLVDDGFDDGNYNDGTDPLDTEWYGKRSRVIPAEATLSIQLDNGTPGIGAGNALLIDRRNGSENGITADLPGAAGGAGSGGSDFNGGDGTGSAGNPQLGPAASTGQVWKLENVGDYIELTFDYRLLGVVSQGGAFQFGFFNREGTPDGVNADSGFPGGGFDDKSYFAVSGIGDPAGGDANADKFRVVQEYGNASHLGGGGDKIESPQVVKTNLDDDDSVGSASFRLTKTGVAQFLTNGIQLTTSLITAEVNLNGDITSFEFAETPRGRSDPPPLLGGTDLVAAVDAFDGFFINGAFASSLDFIVDNVVVTTTGAQVPEPTSLALCAFGLAGAMFARRRRR